MDVFEKVKELPVSEQLKLVEAIMGSSKESPTAISGKDASNIKTPEKSHLSIIFSQLSGQKDVSQSITPSTINHDSSRKGQKTLDNWLIKSKDAPPYANKITGQSCSSDMQNESTSIGNFVSGRSSNKCQATKKKMETANSFSLKNSPSKVSYNSTGDMSDKTVKYTEMTPRSVVIPENCSTPIERTKVKTNKVHSCISPSSVPNEITFPKNSKQILYQSAENKTKNVDETSVFKINEAGCLTTTAAFENNLNNLGLFKSISNGNLCLENKYSLNNKLKNCTKSNHISVPDIVKSSVGVVDKYNLRSKRKPRELSSDEWIIPVKRHRNQSNNLVNHCDKDFNSLNKSNEEASQLHTSDTSGLFNDRNTEFNSNQDSSNINEANNNYNCTLSSKNKCYKLRPNKKANTQCFPQTFNDVKMSYTSRNSHKITTASLSKICDVLNTKTPLKTSNDLNDNSKNASSVMIQSHAVLPTKVCDNLDYNSKSSLSRTNHQITTVSSLQSNFAAFNMLERECSQIGINITSVLQDEAIQNLLNNQEMLHNEAVIFLGSFTSSSEEKLPVIHLLESKKKLLDVLKVLQKAL